MAIREPLNERLQEDARAASDVENSNSASAMGRRPSGDRAHPEQAGHVKDGAAARALRV